MTFFLLKYNFDYVVVFLLLKLNKHKILLQDFGLELALINCGREVGVKILPYRLTTCKLGYEMFITVYGKQEQCNLFNGSPYP